MNEQIEKITNKDVTHYEAIIINNPEEYALTSEYTKGRGRKNHISKIFSTEKAALQWLLSFK